MSAELKIVFAGSVGAGKSTAIQTISDVPVVSTEEAATDQVRWAKALTTVAMDYGQIHLPDGTRIHIYGAPGQTRFDFMWEILGQGAIGVVVLIDDMADDPLRELASYFNAFREHLQNRSLVVGVTRSDLNRSHQLSPYRECVARYDRGIPVFSLDAREPDHVKLLVKSLLFRIDPWLS